MRNNFRNPGFKDSAAPVFQPVLKVEIEIDMAGNTRVNRPAAWSNFQFALFLGTLLNGALQEGIKENSLIINPSKDEKEQPAGITCEEVS